jgi:prepilin-type N-terminal cleavage/methylation domain-containing protein
MSNFNLSKFFKPFGFTLIELMIAIVIITVLSSVGIASFNGISRSNAMQQQAQEIKSLARKLRSDATAGIKTSGNCATNGSLYGAYINFNSTVGSNSTISYGISCWANSTTDYSPTPPLSKTLPTGLTVSSVSSYTNMTIFYSFDGKVSKFDCASLAAKCTDTNNLNKNIAPDQAQIVAPAAINSAEYVVISDGTGSRNYRINFGPTGLVCEEKASVLIANSCST